MQIFFWFAAIIFAFVAAVPLSLIHLTGFSVFGSGDARPKFSALFGLQIIALSLFFFSALMLIGSPFGGAETTADPIKLLSHLLGDYAIWLAVLLVGYLVVLGLLTRLSQRQLEWRVLRLSLLPLAVLTLAIAVPLLINGIQVKTGMDELRNAIGPSAPAATPSGVEIPQADEVRQESEPTEAHSGSEALTDDAVDEPGAEDGVEQPSDPALEESTLTPALRQVPRRFTDEDFEKFNVRVFLGTPSKPDFAGRDSDYSDYRTRLTQTLFMGTNYGGHYQLIQFGCGMGCIFAYVVDLQNGKVSDAPFSGQEFPYLILDYRPNSTMLVALWTRYLEGGNKTCSFAGAFVSDDGMFQVTKADQFATSPNGLCEYPDEISGLSESLGTLSG